jgi:hypothetical protein
MSIIAQYSRISHHTIDDGLPFTVPTQEDFTIKGVSGSWTDYDLALSEIGVDEGLGKVFIRVGTQIYELITDNSSRFSQYIDVFSGLTSNSGTGSEEVIYSKTIPSNYFEDQTGFHIRAGLRTATNADPKEFSLKIGGQIIYSSTADTNNPSDGRFLVDFDFIRNGTSSVSVANVSGSSQISLGTFSNADFNVGVGFTGTYSWSNSIDIEISASASNVDDIELFTVKIYDIK